MSRVRNVVRDLLRRRGYVVERTFAPDYDADVRETVDAVRPYTMTSIHRVAAVCTATKHILCNRIPGAIVECGVWKGGSSMAAALTLVKAGAGDRDLYLYDTFEGIPKPDADDDVVALNGESALDIWHRENARSRNGAWLEAPIDQVRANMASTGYDMSRVHLVKGLVEDTIPSSAPDQIALLRLDTDWYGSTKLEMEELFPRLSPGGILIIDDYGHLEGARRAVDEYLATYSQPVFLSRIDYSGRLAVKPG